MAFMRGVVGLAVAVLIAGQPARAEAAPDATVYTRHEAAFAAGGPAELLRAEAQKRKRIRVIVGLTLKMTPETGLAPEAVAAQRQALGDAQERVAARALAPEADVVRFDTIPYVSIFVGPDGLEKLLKDPEAVSVQLDRPDKPLLRDTIKIIHADKVFAKGFTGAGRVVAVLDTGVDASHPMFAGKIVSEACFSTNDVISGSTSLCPGRAASSVAKGSAADCPVSLNGCFHGTHVASIAVGHAETIDGVARGARLIAIKVFSKTVDDCEGASPCVASFDTDQIKGLERVFALRGSFSIDAVNLSIGGELRDKVCDASNSAFKSAVDNLRTAGIATVVSSGNDGSDDKISDPACVSSVIAVGSTTKTDFLEGSSNHSPLVKILAPGKGILAAGPRKTLVRRSGTSMAAPHVAGAFALLRDAKLNASVDDIVDAISCSGKTVLQRQLGSNLEPVEPQRPRLDVLAAFSRLVAPDKNERNWSFSNPEQEKDWTEATGDWGIVDGAYRLKSFGAGFSVAYASNCSESFRATAEVLLINPPRNCNALGGIIFRATVTDSSKMSGYVATIRPCDDRSVENVAVFKFTDRVLKPPFGGTSEVICRERSNVDFNRPNVIKIVSNAGAHSVFVNGDRVCFFEDTTFPTGVIGPLVLNGDNPPERLFELRDLKTSSSDISPVDPATIVIDAGAYAPKAAASGDDLLDLPGASAAR